MKQDFGLRKKSMMEELSSSGEIFRLKFFKAVVIVLVAAFVVIAFKSEVPVVANFLGRAVKSVGIVNQISAFFS
jgi:hypothetical protein